MRIRQFLAAVAAVAALGAVSAYADGPVSKLTSAEAAAAKGVTQTTALGDGSLKLELTKGYVFIPAPEVPPILKKLDVSGPNAQVLGAVAPAGKKPGAGDYWISVISYDGLGNVPETGGDQLGSITFFDTVKAARSAKPELTSFAVTPAYDPAGKALVWGEQYEAKSPKVYALRHEQRLLGRAGVAGVTTIARPSALEKVKTSAKAVLSMVSFNDGARYSDFLASTDRVSDYDLPGLIDGKKREIAPPPPPPAPAAQAFSVSDLLPGGKYGWASYVGGALLALLAIGGIVGAVRSRQGGGVDTDVT